MYWQECTRSQDREVTHWQEGPTKCTPLQKGGREGGREGQTGRGERGEGVKCIWTGKEAHLRTPSLAPRGTAHSQLLQWSPCSAGH